MTAKKVLDVLDVLQPDTVAYSNDLEKYAPLRCDFWINSGDFLLMELCKIFPNHLPFLNGLNSEAFDQMPLRLTQPGLIEELIYKNIMLTLKTKSPRNHNLERKVKAIWKQIVDKNIKRKRTSK